MTRYLLAALLCSLIHCDKAPEWAKQWTKEQVVKITQGITYLDQAGLAQYADSVRQEMQAGRFKADATVWRADGTGLDAYYDVTNDVIAMAPQSVDHYSAADVGVILLDEAVHRVVPGNDTDGEHSLYRTLIPGYRAALPVTRAARAAWKCGTH